MSTAAPPKIRVPVRDGERWGAERVEPVPSATSSPSPLASHQYREAGSRLLAPVLDPFARAAFWLAITLPWLYLPLVLAPGAFDGPVPGVELVTSSGAVVVALVVLHLAAVVVGHGYARRLT